MARPSLVVEFSPTTGPFDTPDWISLSADGPHGNRVLSAEWTDGKQADLGDWPPGEATIVLDNSDRLFDPEHTAGDYYGQLNPRVPFRIRATHIDEDLLLWDGEPLTWGSEPLGFFGDLTAYDLFYGFVEDGWEQIQNPPKEGLCRVRLVDLLAVIQGYTLLTAAHQEVLTDSPAAYWSLDESTGQVMGDRSGNGHAGFYDNAVLGVDPLIVDATGKSMTVDHVGDNRGQYKGEGLPIAAPVTLEAWVKFERELTQTHMILIAQRDNAYGSGLEFKVETSALGSPNGELVIDFRGLGGFYKARGSTRIDDGEVHHVVMTMASTAAADIKLYVDGALETKTVISGTTGGTWNSHLWWVVGNVAASGAFDFGLGGEIDEVAVYPSALSAARVLAHYEAGALGLAGQRSDEHIQWALDAIGVPATMYDLAEGESIMGSAFTSGQNALAFIRRVTNTEQGAFYVDHANGGKLRFDSRYHSFLETRSTITQATFTDNPASTDVRVERGTLRVEPNGVQTVFNQATVSWRGGTEVVDESTGSPYGPRPISIDTEATSPFVAKGVGEWIINLNSTPQARVRSLGINPGAAQDGYPVALGTRIRDRVEWRTKPQDTGDPITKALEVLGRTTRTQGVHWETTYYLTASPSVGVTLFTLGVSELGSTDILAY